LFYKLNTMSYKILYQSAIPLCTPFCKVLTPLATSWKRYFVKKILHHQSPLQRSTVRYELSSRGSSPGRRGGV
ncbi:hypothetical protein ACXDBF_001127, partial [Cronobacter sakazakii]